MAHFGRDDSFSATRTIQITGSETNENFTTYTIEVTIGSFTWTVKHRYSEFHELHEKLVSSHKVDKGLLPPKKLFGNQTESFVRRRQQDLQSYLQTLINLLAIRPPPALTSFLHFNLYEIHGITQTMAEDLYNRGELLLHSNEVFRVTPLQLHSLTERLKLPEPTCDCGDVRKDLGHILDFITRTKHLQVCGSGEWVGTSNINMNLLPFDLSLFRSLHSLEVMTGRFDMVQGLETVKQTLNFLKVYRTAATIKEVVLQDVPQWKGEDGSQLVGGWDHVIRVDFSHNFIRDIDSSVQILWRVEQLDLSHNQLEGVEHLQWLSHLTWLNLSHNRLGTLEALHTKLGNLRCLLLHNNQIETLHGFSKLFSLEILDVSDNNISKVEDVRPVCQLPCLESLKLTGNSIILSVDYRTRILEMFGDRVGEVSLDGQRASQKEKDTVAVRQALQKAKDARSKQPAPRKNSSSASFSGVCGGRGEGETTPPSIRHSPLPPNCQASGYISTALGQGQRVGSHSQMSTSAPHHHTLAHPWSLPDMRPTLTPASIFMPGRASPAQISISSCASGQELWMEGSADMPSPIPEAHPFDPSFDPVPDLIARKEYDVADLPSKTCHDFVNWLQKHIPTDNTCSPPTPTIPENTNNSLGASHGISHQPETSGVIVDFMWCYAQLYSTPADIFPCCAILTASKLLIQRFSGAADYPGCPGLHSYVVLPLSGIQHLVVGPGYAYLRVEEAFVGKGGLFTLFSVDAETAKHFAELLQDCCTQLDPTNPLEVLDLLCISDLLTEVGLREKRAGGVSSDYLAFTLLVRVKDREEEGKAWLLVMSENMVYLFDAACVYWPPATFQTPQGKTLELKAEEEVSIARDIEDVSLQSPGQQNDSSGAQSQLTMDFSSLPLTLHLQQASAQGPRALTLMFAAASAREVFMERLNNLRARHGQQGTPPTLTLDVPDSGHSDPTDSSFQTCRSRCSPSGIVYSGNDDVCNVSHHHSAEIDTFSFSAPSAVKEDQSQSFIDVEAGGCLESCDVSACPDHSSFSGGSSGRQDGDTVVSVEAEIHRPHVTSVPDVQNCEEDGRLAELAITVNKEPCSGGEQPHPEEAAEELETCPECREPCQNNSEAHLEFCADGKDSNHSDGEEEQSPQLCMGEEHPYHSDTEEYPGLCPKNKVLPHGDCEEAVNGAVSAQVQQDLCLESNKVHLSGEKNHMKEQHSAGDIVLEGQSGGCINVSEICENCPHDSRECSGEPDSEDRPCVSVEKQDFKATFKNNLEGGEERLSSGKEKQSECAEDHIDASENNGAHSEETCGQL